jgi:hypothetical protein
VLGYLPIGLFAPFTGVVFDVDSREPTEQRIREVAQAAGMTYSAFPVQLGTKVNATFPGALPSAAILQTVGWIQALTYVGFGILLFSLGASVHQVVAKVGLGAFGVLLALLGLLLIPPLTRRLRAALHHHM